MVVAKYVDHCPLHRLHRVYGRSGATIPVSTLCDWVGEVADHIEPLVERLHWAALTRFLEDGCLSLDNNL